ncbi:MAG TPA: phosphatase PAP2 family protein [Candidatus Nitrosopolaris sp.]|nr:phosphatase PAP2 family protein [Candidatus Nitrosopolaris sp.]
MMKIRSFEFMVLAIAFVCLSAVVASGLTNSFDKLITAQVKDVQGNEKLDIMMIVITSLGDLFTLVIVGIILTVIRRTRKMGLIFLISIVFIAISIIYLKPVIARQAPPNGFQTSLVFPKYFVLENDSVAPSARDESYPSNHVAIATAFAFVVGFQINKKSRLGGLLLWCFPALIGITKLYLMQHYFTDLIGGFLLGLIISTITSNVLHLDQPFLMSRFKGKEDHGTQQ